MYSKVWTDISLRPEGIFLDCPNYRVQFILSPYYLNKDIAPKAPNRIIGVRPVMEDKDPAITPFGE